MTDKIIEFKKPVDLHKELAFRMNVVSTAERIFIHANGVSGHLASNLGKCLEISKMFHEIAQPYIDEIMAKIEKEAK